MRILLVSDLHYTLKQLDWVTSVAGEYDLVVLAGDHLDIASIVEPDAQIAVISEYLDRIASKTTVVACSGNHDLNADNEHGERAAMWFDAARAAGVFVDGTSFGTEELLVTVCPWWDGPRTRDDVDRQLASDAARVGSRRWIWVYHAPPDASPTSWTGKRHYGDEDLVAWITRYEPFIVMSGHVHQSPFASDGAWSDRIGSTLVLNAGRQIGPVPARVELDTDSGVARWSSLAGIEEASFAGTR
jgi:Icc-related predicted phosphoesterase